MSIIVDIVVGVVAFAAAFFIVGLIVSRPNCARGRHVWRFIEQSVERSNEGIIAAFSGAMFRHTAVETCDRCHVTRVIEINPTVYGYPTPHVKHPSHVETTATTK